MISMCQLYTNFKGKANTWQQGHFRPQSFEYAVFEASLEIFNENRKIWEQSQVVTDALAPYFKRAQISIETVAKGGRVNYPKDYVSFSGIRYLSKKANGGKGVMCDDIDVMNEDGKVCRPLREEEKATKEILSEDLFERDIKKIDSQRWGSIIDHEFLFPSIERPYSTQEEKGFRVLPKGLGVVILSYLSLPERPKFVYTVDAKHKIICDPDKCTDLLWGEEMLPELMSRIKTKYASFVGNEKKYAEAEKETSNAM